MGAPPYRGLYRREAARDMTRDYRHLDAYLDGVMQDTYAQPPDPGHTAWGREAIDRFLAVIAGRDAVNSVSVLDVGCGQAVFAAYFEAKGLHWSGVTIGEDYQASLVVHPMRVYEADMTFLPFENDAYDIAFCRHVLEHSPMPLLTLMELRRVTRKYLALVLPSTDYWVVRGRNHYSVLTLPMWMWLLERSGWQVVDATQMTTEDASYHNVWLSTVTPGTNPSPHKYMVVEDRLLCIKTAENPECK